MNPAPNGCLAMRKAIHSRPILPSDIWLLDGQESPVTCERAHLAEATGSPTWRWLKAAPETPTFRGTLIERDVAGQKSFMSRWFRDITERKRLKKHSAAEKKTSL